MLPKADDYLHCGCGWQADKATLMFSDRAALCSMGSACHSQGQQKSFPQKTAPHSQALLAKELPCRSQGSQQCSGMCRCLPNRYYNLEFVFLVCLLHPPHPIHPSLLLACLPAHHPKEKSLGLVQHGPLSPLTSKVCWHCNWWSSPRRSLISTECRLQLSCQP